MQVELPRYEPEHEYAESLRNFDYYWLADQILHPDDPHIDRLQPPATEDERQQRERDRDRYFYFSNYVRCPKVAFGASCGAWSTSSSSSSTSSREVEDKTAVDETLVGTVLAALENGVVHIDIGTKAIEQISVGRAIQKWLETTTRAAPRRSREQLFLTAKYVGSSGKNGTLEVEDGSGSAAGGIEAGILQNLCSILDNVFGWCDSAAAGGSSSSQYLDLYLLHSDPFLFSEELRQEAAQLAMEMGGGSSGSATPAKKSATVSFSSSTENFHSKSDRHEDLALRKREFQSSLHAELEKKRHNLRRAWGRFEDCARRGLCRSIGVSNFDAEELHDIMFEDKTLRCRIAPVCNQIEAHLHLQDTKLIRDMMAACSEDSTPFVHPIWFGLRDDRSVLPKCFCFGTLFPLRCLAPGEEDIDVRKFKEPYPASEEDNENSRQKEKDPFKLSSEEEEEFEVDTDPELDPLAVLDYEAPYDEEDCWEARSEDSVDTKERKKRKRHRLRLKDVHDLERNPPIDTPFELNRDVKKCLWELGRVGPEDDHVPPEVIAYEFALRSAQCGGFGFGVLFTSSKAERVARVARELNNTEGRWRGDNDNDRKQELEKLSALGKRWNKQRQFFHAKFEFAEHRDMILGAEPEC